MRAPVLKIALAVSIITMILWSPGLAQGQGPSKAPPSEQVPAEVYLEWPRQIISGNYTMIIYQPQVDRWEQNTLSARAAVSIESKASPLPVYGVVWMTARTEVDKEKGIVTLEDTKITRADFPREPGESQEYLKVIQENFPLGVQTIALTRLETNLAVTQAEEQAEKLPLKNDPPRIIFSTKPAVLILIDGKPILRPVQGIKLLRVINTRALILLDESKGKYYLDVMDRWMEARAVEGPWAVAKDPPPALEQARQLLGAKQQEAPEEPEAAPEQADKGEKPPVPEVYVSTIPAELLQTQGKPEFEPISGTRLLAVKNTSDHIFLDLPSQNYFVLFSGRWFRSKSLESGPWEFVSGNNLPADFAKIPESHPRGDVLSAVPGTPQAKEAVIANSIPQTATVKRNEAKFRATYEGAPQFKPIEGTSLEYAANTATPVIKTEPTRYYAVENGVWFTSDSPEGPWVVADSVPAPIYRIPPSSPVHNVTYVRVYGATPEVVYAGYTPGYLGTVISPYNTVLFGTGYYYPHWIGTNWFGWPATFGWGWGYGWGWGRPWWWRPWWGGPSWWRPWWGHSWWWRGWNPWWTGPHGRPWWGHHPPGWCRPGLACGDLYRRGWPKNTIVYSRPRGLEHKALVKPADKGTLRKHGDLYAGQEGKVYRQKHGKKWESYEGKKGWQTQHDVAKKERVGKEKTAQLGQTRRLNQEAWARQRSENRVRSEKRLEASRAGVVRGGAVRGESGRHQR